MGVPHKKWKSQACRAARPAFGPNLHKILYWLWLLAKVAASLTLLVAQGVAQEELPQIMPGERKATAKKDLGPRAIGLLRLTSSGKASLVPIAIMINGRFWDATAYKADPVPMALDSGTVYEVERSGNSLGLFTVNSALHSIAANAPTPWLATGAWLPAGAKAPNQPLKAETVPVGIDIGDAPPRLTRDPSRLHLPETTAPAPAPASPPVSGPSSGDEPPRLTKPVPKDELPSSAPASSPPTSSSTGAGSSQTGSGQSPSQPASQPAPSSTGSAIPAAPKPAETKPPEHPKEPESDSGATDANRPRLRRGKPTGPLPDEEIPGYSKPGVAPSANAAKTIASTAAPEPAQLTPAISDAGGPEPRSFTFEWFKDEEAKHRQQMTALAVQQLRSYLDAQAKATTTAPSSARRHSPAQKPPEPILENVHMTAYDLWVNNQPIMVFSAEAHLPPPPAGAQEGFESGLKYSIVLVAYPDIYNNLHKLYAGVTDKYHLDVTPRLELIDAVDGDGDGRGELLFRETSDAGSGWVIYRATADTLWKMFDSLNPE
jgi:hypothetical protein